MVWNSIGQFFLTAGATFLGTMYIGHQHRKNTKEIIKSNTALAKRRDNLQFAQLKLQYIQDKERQHFQAEQSRLAYERSMDLGKLNHERQLELQQYIEEVQIKINDKTINFQRWRFEQEKELQLEILKRNQNFQRELTLFQRQTSLKTLEEQKRLEHSPIWVVASDILNSSVGEIMPLHIFLSPPKLHYERLANAVNTNKGFPDIELTLAQGLREFFKEYGGFDNRPLDFLGGAWGSASYHSEASVKALRGVLKTEPTVILESEVDGDYLNFRIAYWTYNVANYRYDSVISRLPYRELLYESAKQRAREWLKTRQKLIDAGENPEEVDKMYGGDNPQNLAILQREEKLRKAGVDKREVEHHYMIGKRDVEELSNFMIIYHSVFSGLIADEYFLIEHHLFPALPQLLPNLLKQIPEGEARQNLIQTIVSYYQDITQFFVEIRPTLAPEFILDLALNLKDLTQKNWVEQQLNDSIKNWLKLRGLPVSTKLNSLVDTVKANITDNDSSYASKLNRLLSYAYNDSVTLRVKKETKFGFGYTGNSRLFDWGVDLVLCIDRTWSMGDIIERVKNDAATFHEKLKARMTERGLKIIQLRIRVIVFRDYWDHEPDKVMVTSRFFNLPSEASDFIRFVSGIDAYGVPGYRTNGFFST